MFDILRRKVVVEHFKVKLTSMQLKMIVKSLITERFYSCFYSINLISIISIENGHRRYTHRSYFG